MRRLAISALLLACISSQGCVGFVMYVANLPQIRASKATEAEVRKGAGFGRIEWRRMSDEERAPHFEQYWDRQFPEN